MKKQYILPVLTIALITPFVVIANGNKEKKTIKLDEKTILEKSVPVPDGYDKFRNVALQPNCPRSSDIISSSVSLDSVQENDHCPSCSAGVFFNRGDKLTCSYCEIEKAL